MVTRQQMWDRLGGGSVDLLVVGGGINGAGIARDAARRGLRVALVEMRGLAFGTSSRSSKLVHGGLRYLELFEFSLVFESVSERRILMDIAPHLVTPLPFLFPIYKGSRHKLTMIKGGMWIYEGLSLFRSPKRHRTLSKDEIRQEEPALRSTKLKGAPIYYDCATDDARLTLENALDAVRVGATVCPWAEVDDFVKDESGRVVGASVRDSLSGEVKEVRASVVINATGPWASRVIDLSERLPQPLLRPTKGVHVVVDHEKVPLNNAVVCFHPDDGRVLFAIPWGERTYIGTTDTDEDGDPGKVVATAEDVEYLITASNSYFPDFEISTDDIISTWAGLRPLMWPAESSGNIEESAVSREHQVIVGEDGLITIAGGKLTTYRRVSEEVVETAIKLLRLTGRLPASLSSAHTDTHPLPGAVGWPDDDDRERVAARVSDVGGEALSDAAARHLTDTYGMLALELAQMVRDRPGLGASIVEGRPEVLAQIEWAVREELAATVEDVLTHRTQIFHKDLDQGLGVVDEVADRMQVLLGWDGPLRDRMVEQYRAQVAHSRAWRKG